MNALSNKRIGWIDIAKGICILSIIAGHYGNEIANKIVFSFHLTIFFILSGYTLRVTNINKSYLKKKFDRLMTPYFLTCFFCLVMSLLNSILFYKDASILTLSGIVSKLIGEIFFASGSITNFGFIDWGGRIGAIWFLPALFFALIMVQCILNKTQDFKKALSLGVILFFASYCSTWLIWIPFSLQSAMFSVPFILLGYYFKRYEILSKIHKFQIFIAFLILMISFFLNFSKVFFVRATAQSLTFSCVCSLIISVGLMKICELIKQNRILEFLGRNSLMILCIHLFELNTLSIWYIKYLPTIIQKNFMALYLIRLSLILVFVFIIKILQHGILSLKNCNKLMCIDDNYFTNRNQEIDICKAILIVLMLVGHWNINENLRNFIYSFHMLSFVILSGYFFKESDDLKKELLKLVKALLLPYIVFSICFLMINYQDLVTGLITIIFGMSFSNLLFENVNSVGPVYFILLLFLIRFTYLIINYYVKDQRIIFFIVFICYVFGYYCGKFGLWLPWSFDCALVCLIFYHYGYLLKKYDLLNLYIQNNYLYFLISSIFAFYVLSGGMELAVRNYNDILIMSLGTISAILILIALSNYLKNIFKYNIFIIFKWAFLVIGQNTLYILIVHSLFKGFINAGISYFYDLNYIYAMIISVSIQILIGCFVGKFVNEISQRIRIFKLNKLG